MGWFKKPRVEIVELSQKITPENQAEEVEKAIEAEEIAESLTPTVKIPTIDLIDQDVERKTTLFYPETYGSIKPMVDELIEHKVILVDFSKLLPNERIRTIDFVSGVMYGLNGEYKKVEHHVYKFIVRK